MQTSPLTVVIVHGDEHERGQIRAAFEAFPGVQVAGERADIRAGLALAHQVNPAVLTLDLRPPVDDVIAAAAAYRLEHPEVALFLIGDALDADTLLRALRAGAHEVLRRPFDRATIGQAVERVAALRARKQGRPSERMILSVHSPKGGSGVSTLATNLAVGLKRQSGREVAVADFDCQSGDAAFLMGLNPTRSLADLLVAARIDSASMQDALVRHETGVHVLSQPEALDRMDGLTAAHAGQAMDVLASLFDFVVVDTPHLLGDVTLELLDRSSGILLVVEPSVPSVRAARRALDVFQRLDYCVTPGRVRLVVNRFLELPAVTIGQIEETLGLQVFATIANDYSAVSRSITLGRPLCAGGLESRAARDLGGLARLLLPGTPAAPVAEAAAHANGLSRHPVNRLFQLLGRSAAK